jgi:peptidyl-prolyl cis-trans isomerase B (cyclophilin B)
MTFNQEARLENNDIVAVLKTNNGTMTIKLFTQQAPKTTLNFMGLAQKGYYNGIIFHRIIKGFMLQ